MKILIFLIVLIIVVVGYYLVMVISDRKWGYTEEREKELEEGSLEDRIKGKR